MTENDKMRAALDLAAEEYGYDSWNNVLKIMVDEQDTSFGIYTLHQIVEDAVYHYDETFKTKEK